MLPAGSYPDANTCPAHGYTDSPANACWPPAHSDTHHLTDRGRTSAYGDANHPADTSPGPAHGHANRGIHAAPRPSGAYGYRLPCAITRTRDYASTPVDLVAAPSADLVRHARLRPRPGHGRPR